MPALTTRLRDAYSQPHGKRRKPGATDIFIACCQIDALEKLVRECLPHVVGDMGHAAAKIEERLRKILE